MKRFAVLGVLLAGLGGCAHLPEAKVGYYLPTSDVTFKVVRTVACDSGGNPIVATAVTPTVRHFANTSGDDALKTVTLSKLNGHFSDSDVKFDFYEDGRLAGVNETVTGQGETILKTVVSVAATAVKAGVGILVLTPTECQQIKDFGGNKPLTVTYTSKVGLTDGAVTELKADADSEFYVKSLAAVLQPVRATAVSHSVPAAAPVAFTASANDVLISARQPGAVHIKVTVDGIDKPLWEDDVTVATVGTDYVMPIPRPDWFGTKKLTVAFAESGAVKSVQYVSNTGTGQALNVANAGLAAVQPETTAQQAADVKAEADLIAQQQRLVACKADPTNCK